MPAHDLATAHYPTLGYLTRRQPPGTGTLPGAEPDELQGAVAG